MGVTNFPDQVSSGGTVVEAGLSSVTGAGTITTTLDTITSVNVSLAAVPGTASDNVAFVQGTAHADADAASTFIVRAYQATGSPLTAGTVAANVAWQAVGTKS